jgi:hypothetical protein
MLVRWDISPDILPVLCITQARKVQSLCNLNRPTHYSLVFDYSCYISTDWIPP